MMNSTFTRIKKMTMKATMRNLMGLAAGLSLAAGAWATTQNLDPTQFGPNAGSPVSRP